MLTRVKTHTEIEAMRVGGRILSNTLRVVAGKITPGIRAIDIDKLATEELKRHGVKAAFLGYKGFPASICVSVNDEVVHGIPTAKKIIKAKDVVSLDLGVVYDGMIVDGATTVVAGPAPRAGDPKARLLEATELSLENGLAAIKHGCRVGDISNAIQKTLEKNNLGIVTELVGHGVGHDLHEEPNIPNFGSKGTGTQLAAGMTIAVEPMATLGEGDIYIDSDGWTVKTTDKSLSAQFEHTVLVTRQGCEILTIG
jgi:methionyl aminopeptidase